MTKLLFWSFIALDVGALLLFFVLGLAAAGSARTSSAMLVLLMLVLPMIPVAGSIWLFVKSPSTVWRTAAFALAALPVVFVASTQVYSNARFSAHSNAAGELTFFKAGPERDLVDAIRRNDTLGVTRALASANVNAVGMDDMTPLVAALRQLRSATKDVAVLRLLLDAGADPNKGTEYELPLEMALQASASVSVDAVALLLKAGANPSVKNSSGTPVYFAGAGFGAPPEELRLLLASGADLRATSSNGETVLIYAATARNWKAAHFLLEQGADWTQGRSPKGLTFRELVEEMGRERDARGGNVGDLRANDGLAEVIAFLRSR